MSAQPGIFGLKPVNITLQAGLIPALVDIRHAHISLAGIITADILCAGALQLALMRGSRPRTSQKKPRHHHTGQPDTGQPHTRQPNTRQPGPFTSSAQRIMRKPVNFILHAAIANHLIFFHNFHRTADQGFATDHRKYLDMPVAFI